jgi:hypothetical protein
VSDKTPAEEARILHEIITKLSRLDDDGRQRLLQTVATFYNLSASATRRPSAFFVETIAGEHPAESAAAFSSHEDLTPKDYLREKQPLTDVERVACLAFYLSHYRNMRHFKTLDISKLNTEAAQPKFSNPSLAISNASRTGYIAEAPKGYKQISAAGEQFVLALPDRQAAKEAMNRTRPRRYKVVRKGKKN